MHFDTYTRRQVPGYPIVIQKSWGVPYRLDDFLQRLSSVPQALLARIRGENRHFLGVETNRAFQRSPSPEQVGHGKYGARTKDIVHTEYLRTMQQYTSNNTKI